MGLSDPWLAVMHRTGLSDGCTLISVQPTELAHRKATSTSLGTTRSSKQQCTQKGSHLHKHFGKVLQAREHAGVESSCPSGVLAILCVKQAARASVVQLSIWGGTHGVARRAPAEPDATGACLQAVQLAPMRKQYVTCLDLLSWMN
jgi:hypothetical protein